MTVYDIQKYAEVSLPDPIFNSLLYIKGQNLRLKIAQKFSLSFKKKCILCLSSIYSHDFYTVTTKVKNVNISIITVISLYMCRETKFKDSYFSLDTQFFCKHQCFLTIRI